MNFSLLNYLCEKGGEHGLHIMKPFTDKTIGKEWVTYQCTLCNKQYSNEMMLMCKVLYSPAPGPYGPPQQYPTSHIEKRYQLIHDLLNYYGKKWHDSWDDPQYKSNEDQRILRQVQSMKDEIVQLNTYFYALQLSQAQLRVQSVQKSLNLLHETILQTGDATAYLPLLNHLKLENDLAQERLAYAKKTMDNQENYKTSQ